MASTKTLAAMMTMTRELANQETNSGSEDFISDPELRRRLNEALASLYDKLIAAYPEEHYVKELGDTAITANTNSYTLPDDFYRLVTVVLKNGQIYHRPAIWSHLQMADMRRSSDLGRGSIIYNMYYRLQGNKIQFLPTPVVSGWYYDLWYVPTFTPFATDGTQDTNTFDGVNGWEKWACLTAAIQCLVKEEQDPGGLMQALAAEDKRIDTLASSRDQGQAETLIDVQGSSEYRLRRNYWLFRLPPA